MFDKPDSLQRQINDLVTGKHKCWHVEAMKTSTYGELGREFITDRQWEFVLGFDTRAEAQETLELLQRRTDDGVEYGGDDYEFRLSEEVGGHRRWRD